MVRLNRIYTRTGDDGSTGLIGGDRRSKSDLRIEAIGAVDEANAAIGVARQLCSGELEPLAETLAVIQNDLFDLGADLAAPTTEGGDETGQLRITDGQATRLEKEIDRFNDDLSPLESFVLPGGSAAAAALHSARTIVRRAERVAVALGERSGEAVRAPCLRYLNRLSDLLFVMARWANDRGERDVLWIPGQHR